MEKTASFTGRVIMIDSAEDLKQLCRRMLCSGFDGDVTVLRGCGRWFMIMSEIPLYACDYGDPLGRHCRALCRRVQQKDLREERSCPACRRVISGTGRKNQ